MYANQTGFMRLTAVDEWLILSKRNFKFDLGDILLLPSAEDGHKERTAYHRTKFFKFSLACMKMLTLESK